MGSWIDLGLMEYQKCFDLQKRVIERVFAREFQDTLLFVQHPKVLTLGAGFQEQNLLFSKEKYAELGIDVVKTDRGGDVTYHGPGQLVIYPIFNIANYGKDLHKWLRALEECMIQLLMRYGLEGYRFPPHTGVWVKNRKVAAIGIKVKRWVNLHGIALNCNNDLTPFSYIVPCGVHEYGVTSLTQELQRVVTQQDALQEALLAFQKVFRIEFSQMDFDQLELLA